MAALTEGQKLVLLSRDGVNLGLFFKVGPVIQARSGTYRKLLNLNGSDIYFELPLGEFNGIVRSPDYSWQFQLVSSGALCQTEPTGASIPMQAREHQTGKRKSV